MGERKKRSVTRREITSQVAAKNVTKAPVIWRFTPGSRAFGIFIDEARCWMGNEAGAIYSLDHDGKVLDQFKLPEGVKCIVADDDWLYAGCDNGKVYDLGGKAPRVAYEIADDIDIYWLDIKDGVLGVSDEAGNVAVFNHEDEIAVEEEVERQLGLDAPLRRGRRLPRPLRRRDDVRLGRRQEAVALQDRRLGAVRLAGRVDGVRQHLPEQDPALHQARQGAAHVRVRCRGVLVRGGRGRQVRVRRRQLLVGVLLQRGRRAAVEAQHRLRLGVLDAVLQEPALHRHDRRQLRGDRRERGRDRRREDRHRCPRPSRSRRPRPRPPRRPRRSRPRAAPATA